MEKLKIMECFGGIGACSKALSNLGIDYEIADYVEIDKYACKSFNAIHGTNFEPQDICTWDKDIEVDLIMHGSPCQDFSSAGLQAGGDKGSGTRSSLMYETLRIVEKLKPKYVVWENVKNLLSMKHVHNFNAYLEKMNTLGYSNDFKLLNAKDYGIPQNRERVFVISILGDNNFKFPDTEPLNTKLKDFLEENVDKKYIVSNKLLNYYDKKIKQGWRKELHLDKDIASTICNPARNNVNDTFVTYKEYTNFYVIPRGSDGKLINGSYNRVWKKEKQVGALNLTKIQEIAEKDKNNNLHIRKLTSRETWRLMGFSDDDYNKTSKVCSESQLYKQAGNTIVVNVLMAIFKNLFD